MGVALGCTVGVAVGGTRVLVGRNGTSVGVTLTAGRLVAVAVDAGDEAGVTVITWMVTVGEAGAGRGPGIQFQANATSVTAARADQSIERFTLEPNRADGCDQEDNLLRQ